MRIGSRRPMPGRLQRGFVETAGYIDGIRLRLPVIVARGARPGPTLAVVAGQHGRELNGPAAIYYFIRALRPGQMQGTILLFPAVNHLSMRQTLQDYPTEYARYFKSQPAQTHLNVNRTWPGDPKGTLQQRMTYAVWRAGVEAADAVIDLHAWSERVIGLAWSHQRHASLLRAFGFPFNQLSAKPQPIEGMLEAACLKAGKPYLVCEITPQDIVNGQGVQYGLQGLLNVARHLGIVAGRPEFPWPRYELAAGDDVSFTSQQAGLVVTTHRVGDVLEPGEDAVELVDLMTFRRIQVCRPSHRMILRRVGGIWREGYIGYHYVQPGETIATFSRIEREWPAGEEPT